VNNELRMIPEESTDAHFRLEGLSFKEYAKNAPAMPPARSNAAHVDVNKNRCNV
jgi:hypothetical protein